MKSHHLKRIIPVVTGLIVLVAALWGVQVYGRYIKPTDYETYRQSGDEEHLSELVRLGSTSVGDGGMTIVAQTDELQLLINESTAEIGVIDSLSGQVFYSNPQGRDEDPLANGTNRELLASQLYIEYYDQERLKKEMNSFSDAVQHGQFTIHSIEDGVRITYTIGNLEKGVEALPMFITEERLKTKVLDQLDDRTKRTVNKYYVESVKEPGYLEMRQQVEEARIVLNKMLKAFEEAGYTEEDLEFDNQAVGYVSDIQKIIFTIPVDYKLDQDKLVVKINTEEIITEGPGKLAVIQPLAFFGAGSTEENGYLMVPSGSGALIDFNNGKENYDYYYEKVYGYDPVTASRYSTQYQETVRMPVYGIKKDKQAFLARITDGEGIAAIKADVSGRVNSYNTVGPVFSIRDTELTSLFGASGINADLPLVESRSYEGNLSITYSFLSDEDANYSGMAKSYRRDLMEEGVLDQDSDATLPFYLDILGAMEKKAFILGVPYRDIFVATSPEQALEIAQLTAQEKVSNIKLRYQGWFNDGYYHDVARDIDVLKGIGGTQSLYALDEGLQTGIGDLFLDVAFTEVTSLSDNYSNTFESSRYLAGVNVFKAPYHPSLMRMYTFYEEEFMRVVSPAAMIRHVEGFSDDMKELGPFNLSLRDLGDMVASDKKSQAPIDREWSKDISQAMIESLSDQGEHLMVQGGNAYSWSYATDMIDVSMGANNYYIIDRPIPFLQMVVKGSIDYGSKALNLTSYISEDQLILKMIETGTAPRFVWSDASSAEFVKTPYQMFYAADYRDWLEIAARIYRKTAETLNEVKGALMEEHTYLEEDVVMIGYDNGQTIYINYGDDPYLTDGVSIPPVSHVLKGSD